MRSIIASIVEKHSKHIFLLSITLYSLLTPYLMLIRGFHPQDDARRHAAKVLSGKAWSEILVLRPEFSHGDMHAGWHGLLGLVNDLIPTNSGYVMVIFAVVSLFLFTNLIPFFFTKDHRSWLLAIGIFSLFGGHLFLRTTIGRPYIFTLGVFFIVWLTWDNFKHKQTSVKFWIIYSILFSLDAWLHPSWYLYLFPLGIFFISKEIRACLKIACTMIIGVVVASLLSGNPINYFYEQIVFITTMSSSNEVVTQLVRELQPQSANTFTILMIMVVLFIRRFHDQDIKSSLLSPPFIMYVVATTLGYFVGRFYLDWGSVAIFVWIVRELDLILEEQSLFDDLQITGIALFALLISCLNISTDFKGRYSNTAKFIYPNYKESTKEEKAWFPGKGGIIYSNTMDVYYGFFYTNPHGDWKYILGHESALMPVDDLKTYREHQYFSHSLEKLKPWVSKLRPEDRLVLDKEPIGAEKHFPKLEWKNINNHWFGRKKVPFNKDKQMLKTGG